MKSQKEQRRATKSNEKQQKATKSNKKQQRTSELEKPKRARKNQDEQRRAQKVQMETRLKKLALVNISDCNVNLKSIKCLRVAWSIAAALVIECKFFETDIIMELFLENGVVCTFVARWI